MFRTFVGAILLVLVLPLLALPSADDVFKYAVLPDSDIVTYANQREIAGTPFDQPLRQLKQRADAMQVPGLEPEDPFSELLKAVTNVRKRLALSDSSNSLRTLFSLKIPQQVPEASFSPMQYLASLDSISLYEMRRPLNKDAVRNIVLEEMSSLGIEIGEEEIEGGVLLLFGIPDAQIIPECGLALLQEGKVLIAGKSALVKAALERVKGKQEPALPAPLRASQAAIAGRASAYAVFAPNELVRQTLVNRLGESPMAMLGKEFASLAIAVKTTDKLGFSADMVFNDPQSATAAKSMLMDGFLMGMGKMYLAQAAGQPIPLLESMKTSVTGNTASFSCEVTAQELPVVAGALQAIGRNLRQRRQPNP